MMKKASLVMLPSLTVKVMPSNKIVVTRKFIEGVLKYQKYWESPVKVLAEEAQDITDDVDQVIIHPNELPFEIKCISYTDRHLVEHLQGGITLGGVSYRQNHISQLCQLAGIPCIYTAEYTFKTRRQIVNVTTPNPAKQLRRLWWEYRQEQKQRYAVTLADGLQCNGFPIFEEYRSLNRNPLLYLDTRVTEEMVATSCDVEQRASHRTKGEPLQLVFSGRLNKMKGADHLLDVAIHLKRMGIEYHLYICGTGSLQESMQKRIYHEQLETHVTMLGALDFQTELFPFVKKNIDLFICCHRQGDPSCTYLETMAAGVPIVGYSNEAFEKLIHYSRSGWLVPINHPELLARQVATLNSEREQIKTKALAAQRFAQVHTFEETFRRRIEHIHEVVLEVTSQKVRQKSFISRTPYGGSLPVSK